MIKENSSRLKNSTRISGKCGAVLTAVAIVFSLSLAAQDLPATYFVPFTDKAETPYSVDDPGAFLSVRAVARRVRQGIPVTEEDLPVDPNYIFTVSEISGVRMRYPLKWLNGAVFEIDDTSAVSDIRDLSFVIGENVVMTSPPIKNTGKLNWSLGLDGKRKKARKIADHDIHGASKEQIEQIGLDSLHGLGYRGAGITVAVLDAGYRNAKEHEIFKSLFEEGRVIAERDFAGFTSGEMYTSSGHGTSVLGVLAAYSEGELIGAAPEADYILVRTEYAPFEYLVEEYNWIAGAEFADSAGADILNTSLGYTEFDDPAQDHVYEDLDGNTTPVTRGSNIAASKGILVVNSAGNYGDKDWKYISAPADGDKVLAVGSVDAAGETAASSGRGPNAAGAVKPDVVARGVGVATVGAEPDNIIKPNGTSFASPLIAGGAACLWSFARDLTGEELFDLIRNSGHRADDPDNETGYGIPDFTRAYRVLEDMEIDSITARKPHTIIFPNPASNEITVITPRKGQFQIHDVSGNKVRSGVIDRKIILNIGNLIPGIYIFIMDDERVKFVRD